MKLKDILVKEDGVKYCIEDGKEILLAESGVDLLHIFANLDNHTNVKGRTIKKSIYRFENGSFYVNNGRSSNYNYSYVIYEREVIKVVGKKIVVISDGESNRFKSISSYTMQNAFNKEWYCILINENRTQSSKHAMVTRHCERLSIENAIITTAEKLVRDYVVVKEYCTNKRRANTYWYDSIINGQLAGVEKLKLLLKSEHSLDTTARSSYRVYADLSTSWTRKNICISEETYSLDSLVAYKISDSDIEIVNTKMKAKEARDKALIADAEKRALENSIKNYHKNVDAIKNWCDGGKDYIHHLNLFRTFLRLSPNDKNIVETSRGARFTTKNSKRLYTIYKALENAIGNNTVTKEFNEKLGDFTLYDMKFNITHRDIKGIDVITNVIHIGCHNLYKEEIELFVNREENPLNLNHNTKAYCNE